MTVAQIANGLGGRKSPAGWLARCPFHDDGKPSLSLTERDGRILVKCHAGCAHHPDEKPCIDKVIRFALPREGR